MEKLSHYDEAGEARMVDVSAKAATRRQAEASAFVAMSARALAALPHNPKGNPLEVARIAGIQAAKRTADLIPMCHPLLVGAVHVNFNIGDDYVEVEAQVETVDRTGVEMEALTACSIAALTVYDMCKSVDRGMTIMQIQLEEKAGGRRGVFKRPEESPVPAAPDPGRAPWE